MCYLAGFVNEGRFIGLFRNERCLPFFYYYTNSGGGCLKVNWP